MAKPLRHRSYIDVALGAAFGSVQKQIAGFGSSLIACYVVSTLLKSMGELS